MSEAVANMTATDIVRDILDSIIRDIVQKDPANIASSFVDSIVNQAVPLPLSPIASECIKESVANVATLGAATKIVVTAEIHNEPGVLKSVNKENELVRTEAVLVTVNVKLLSEWNTYSVALMPSCTAALPCIGTSMLRGNALQHVF